MTYAEQYAIVRRTLEYCLVCPDPNPKPAGGPIMYLLGAADNYVEVKLLEELMLDSLEGLS